MKPIFVSAARIFALCSVVLLNVLSPAKAATLVVSPVSVSNFYSGKLTIQIGGLTNGESVRVERYLDPNTNHVIDAGEPVVQSFLLTDGQGASIGGVRNSNVPGDNDAAVNGQITATLNFADSPEFSRGSGNQIFRLSSPFNRFAAVQTSITVTQSVLGRKITGTVSSGASALAYAWVAALVQIGTDQQLVSAATANASGNFSLNVTNNATYVMVAFKPGYIGNFATSPQVTISGADTNVSIPLSAANLTMAGNVTESVSGAGIAGVQCFASSANNDYLVLFSDPQGNFNVPIISGQWKIDPSDFSAQLGGYVRSQNKTKVTVSTVNVTGVNIQFTKATALIYGTLKTDQNVPLAGAQLFAGDGANLFASSTETDTNGNFFLGALSGTWFVGPSQGNTLPGGYILPQVQVTLATGQALQTNLIATRAAAYLAGRAFDGNNNPISNGSMIAFSGGGPGQSVQLGGDGSFALPVSAGSWTLSLDTQSAASQNVVPPQIAFNVVDGVNVSNIVYIAPIATRTISGSVKTATNSPISGINVFAGAVINGTNFNTSASTDSTGSYSLPVLPGMWYVGVDSQGLNQRGYPSVQSQNVDTTTSAQIANFIVGGQPIGSIFFRESMGIVGEFGANPTATVNYPVVPKNYRVMFHVFNDTNPPGTANVLFTGPAGSGMTNTAADPAFGVVQDGTNVFYLSPPVKNPSAAPGGTWVVNYNGNVNTFEMPDPQVNSRIAVPVPTVTLTNGMLSKISWSYRDGNGNLFGGIPSFINTSRIDLFDQNGNVFDSQAFAPSTSYSYPANSIYDWANIGLVRMVYVDNLTNQYFFNFSESSPTLTGAALVSGQSWQFLLNGPPAQNYTVQYATILGPANWQTLYVTNGAASPLKIVDPAATNSARFYRVLVGP